MGSRLPVSGQPAGHREQAPAGPGCGLGDRPVLGGQVLDDFQAAAANSNLAANAAQGNTTIQGLQLPDFSNVLLTVNPQVLKRSPNWWLHPQVLAYLILIRDAMGRPLFQTFTETPAPGPSPSVRSATRSSVCARGSSLG